jgi:long-chain acyl-CoA synthetase
LADHIPIGREVVAFIVPRSGLSVNAAELDALCVANIARFKRPKAYIYLDALPKNSYGKVVKAELRALSV